MSSNINSDLAYDYIRRRIIGGEYAPGQHLNAKALAVEIEVSVTPVRDALRQLETDGLVTIHPRQGAQVNAMDLKEFRNLCELRLILETHAAGMAAHRRSDIELQEMALALEEMRQLTQQLVAGTSPNEAKLLAELARADAQFHVAIMTAAKNELIRDEILRLQLIDRVIGRATAASGGKVVTNAVEAEHLRKVQSNHEAIYQAIERRDAEAAKTAMEQGLQGIIEQTLWVMARRERERLTSELTEEEAGQRKR